MSREATPAFRRWVAAAGVAWTIAAHASAQAELPPPPVAGTAPPPGVVIRVIPPPPVAGIAPVTASGIEVDLKGMPGVAPAPCPPNLTNWYGLRPDLRDPCATVTPGAMPMPIGWYARSWNARMTFRASAERYVVHAHEWYKGGLTLGPYGETHIAGIAASLPKVPFPVVIEACGPPALVEARRRVVVELLLARGIVDAERRVVVGFSEAEGYRYDDLPRGRRGAGGLRGAGGMGGRGGMGGIGGGGFGGALGVPTGIPGY